MSQATCHPDRKMQARGLCKNCYDKGLKARNPAYAERQRYNTKQWAILHPRKAAQIHRASSRRQETKPGFKEKRWAASIKRKYGVTAEQYYAQLDKQRGVCAICWRQPDRAHLHVDHCHTTGKFRGLLCFRCNYGLGWWGNDVQRLRRALNYLYRQQPKLNTFAG